MTHARMFGVVISLSVLLALTACGGGGGGGGGGGTTPPGPAATQTYLFYTGSLTALDPVAPGAPITVESGFIAPVSGVQPIGHGTYDPATRSLSDLHNRTIVYAKGANLFKVSALKNQTPTPVQLSSESGVGAAGVCETFISRSVGPSQLAAPDYQNHDNARYVYSLAGADNDCAADLDNVWKMVKVGMTSSDAPKTISGGRKPITEIVDPATGGLMGWLTHESTSLIRRSVDFTGLGILITGGVSSATFIALSPEGKIFLQLNNELKMYDPGSGALSPALHVLTGSLGNPLSDGSHLYFLDGDQSIYKLALDGASTATEFRAVTGTETITALALTANRVVFVVRNSATNVARLSSRIKTGMSLDLILKTTPAGKGIFILGTAANRIYYHWGDSLLALEIASTVTEDGTLATELTTSRWSGVTSASSGKLGTSPFLANVTLVDIVASPRTLTVYDAPGGTAISTHTLPSGINAVFFSGLVNDGYILGNASLVAAGEIFLVNANVNNSLVRITDTAGVNEHVVGGCTLNPAGAFDPLFGLILLLSAIYVLRRRGWKRARVGN